MVLANEIPVVKESEEVGKSPRYLFVDALRGIAALWVLLHHLTFNSNMKGVYATMFPRLLLFFMEMGKYGVEIFFILSGFVIAHSVRKFKWTGKEIGNFILRRQLRLDPPYWIMIFLTLIEQAVVRHIPNVDHTPAPGILALLANLFYVQKLTQSQPIVLPAWTLCIEIQFYIFFVLLCFIGHRIARNLTRIQGMRLTQILTVVTGTLSLIIGMWRPQWFSLMAFGVHSEWFGEFWFYFVAGAFCYWTVQQQTKPVFFFAFMLTFAGIALSQSSAPMICGLVTTLLLYASGRTGHLSTWLANPVLQYFGRISYSLYLVHFLVGLDVLRIAFKISHGNHSTALLWFLIAGFISIICAHALHYLIEKPSMQFASKLKITS